MTLKAEMIEKVALLPCPFCGGAVKLEQTVEAMLAKSDEWWGVVCRNDKNLGGTCAIQQRPSRTREAATTRWNTRAAIEALASPSREEELEAFVRDFLRDARLPPNVSFRSKRVTVPASFLHRAATLTGEKPA